MPDIFAYGGQVLVYDVVAWDATTVRPYEIALAASANIAAGAVTATSAQLTAPSGKTTSDFSPMKISDDTNPVTSDIGQNFYGEGEWNMQATAEADSVAYEFRVTIDGVLFDTYTNTPVLLIVDVVPMLPQVQRVVRLPHYRM